MEVNYIGRPGYTTILSSKRKPIKTDEFVEVEEKRFKSILEGFEKVKELEDEKLGISGLTNKHGGEICNFKLIKENQIVKDDPPAITYSKSCYTDQGEFLYKMVKTEGKLVRSVLEAHGFSHTDGHDWNVLWTCTSCKPYLYEGLNEFQKINHFPQSSELTRKDSLCANVVKMQEKFGNDVFDIIPDTYILPDEFADFYSHFHSLKNKGKEGEDNMWIVKPSASSKGKGIYIIDDISEAPIKENCIISKYVNNPLLINGLKFDMRLYVLVTSMDPWRIYLYKEGIARFASEPYSSQGSKTNRFSHLTNYSINKKHEKYIHNFNLETDDEGNKWSMSALCKYLESIGVDLNLMWSKIYDIIIKSFLCVDSHIYNGMKSSNAQKNCFEVFGFDILLDSDLKPWVLEANLSPSFATDSPLDMAIKTNLLTDVFNLICIRKFDRRRDNINKMKQRFKPYSKHKHQSRGISSSKSPNVTKLDSQKRSEAQQYLERNRSMCEKLSQISSKNKTIIRDTLIEDQRKGNFIRIYPCKDSDIYDQYFLNPRASNKIIHKYLFGNDLVPCELPRNFTYSSYNSSKPILKDKEEKSKPKIKNRTNRSHTNTEPVTAVDYGSNITKTTTITPKLPEVTKKQKSNPISKKNSSVYNMGAAPDTDTQNSEKLMITGDDVLIEYVARLMIAIKSIREKLLRQSWKHCIDKFIRHYVWHTSDTRRRENNKLWQRLESRLIEMKERRKRLLRSLYKKESNNGVSRKNKDELNAAFEKEYEIKEQQKNVIIQALSALELEDMLRTSTKNVAHEVVSCLVEPTGRGVLTDIIRWLTTSQQNMLNDHLSILDSSEISNSTKYNNYGDEDPEDCEDSESFYNTKSSMNNSGIRIKVRK